MLDPQVLPDLEAASSPQGTAKNVAPLRDACAYGYAGCAKPASAAPAGVLISHGICEPCAIKVRAGETPPNVLTAGRPLCPTPDSVLSDACADLAILLGDLLMSHAVDGYEDLSTKLRGIAVTAERARHALGHLDEAGEFARIQAEAEQGVAADARVRR